MIKRITIRIRPDTDEVYIPDSIAETSDKLLVRETRYFYRDLDVLTVIRSRLTNTRRYIIKSFKGSPEEIETYIDPGSSLFTLENLGDLYIARSDRILVIKSRYMKCYNENTVGPFKISETESITTLENNFLRILVKASPNKICEDHLIISDPKTEINNNILRDLFNRLSKGYYEDGLIWALIRSGRVPRHVLPSFIEDEQAYYWPRGDLLRKSFYNWYLFDNEFSLQIYLEIIQQIIDQMSESGGLLIPYITAARKSNIYGSPQQLYLFESLYRAYQVLGIEDLRSRALNALRCYIEQPPRCLGFYETRGGGIWFRWGSYHYLSRDPEGKEDLYVLNTHLMGLVGLSEAWFFDGCTWCREYALKGLRGLMNLLSDFQRRDGYLYYSLFNKEIYGESEDQVMPHTLGYHTLSSRYILRLSYLLRNPDLIKYGDLGCQYSLEKYFGGRRDIRDELVRCLLELYRATREKRSLETIEKILREDPQPPLKILGLGLDEIMDNIIPPKIISVNNNSTILLIENKIDEALYYVYSSGVSKLVIDKKILPSKKIIEIKDLEIEDLSTQDPGRGVLVKRSQDNRFEIELSDTKTIIVRLYISNNPT
ncbi:MAG: hypothetical protein ACP5I7_06855 [Sulfolobales archaeon]